nr:DUF2617 family protein [Rhodococcus sp. HNM0569]
MRRLEIEPRDVAASALGLVLGNSTATPLVETTVADRAGRAVVLGVLGASHVVRVHGEGGGSGAPVLVEEVSCDALARGGEPLPRTKAAGAYRFTSQIRSVEPDAFAETAAELRARATDDAWVCGAFPGDDALTALTATIAADGELRWQTWHLYPQPTGGDIVTTHSRWAP